MPISWSLPMDAHPFYVTLPGSSAKDFGAPMDVMWFRLPRLPTDTEETQGRFDTGHIFVMLQRGDYWQCAYVIPKGGDAQVRAAGLETFRKTVGALLPFDAGARG